MGNAFVNPVTEVNFEPSTKYSELLIGCGRSRKRQLHSKEEEYGWSNLVTLDINVEHNPDYVHDLNDLPYPFIDESFDEIHAYEVLEHCGTQGDWRFFFAQFTEFHRILRPHGRIFGSVPCWDGEWAWGDPGHTRVITPQSLGFLQQSTYDMEDVPTTDYRSVYKVDFRGEWGAEKDGRFWFILRKQ